MALKILFQDSGSSRTAHLTQEGHVITADFGCPPLVEQKNRVFREYLETSGGSNDMGIDGSTTAAEFYISAHEQNDTYITTLSFEMTCGSQPQGWEFADSNAALTNGCRLWYERPDGITYIHDDIVRNWDLIRLGLGEPTITAGNVADTFVTRYVASSSDFGIIPVVDLTRFVPPYGIKLDRGTSQRLVFEVRDDCTDADTFNCIAYGFERLP